MRRTCRYLTLTNGDISFHKTVLPQINFTQALCTSVYSACQFKVDLRRYDQHCVQLKYEPYRIAVALNDRQLSMKQCWPVQCNLTCLHRQIKESHTSHSEWSYKRDGAVVDGGDPGVCKGSNSSISSLSLSFLCLCHILLLSYPMLIFHPASLKMFYAGH